MEALFKLSLKSKISLGLCLVIITAFFSVQFLAVVQVLDPSYALTVFGFCCILLFVPCFFIIGYEFWWEQKEHKRSFDDKYQAINLSNMVVILDYKGYILEANANFCAAIGYKPVELIGKHHKLLVPKEQVNTKEYRDFWAKLLQGNYVEGDYNKVKKDGTGLWIHATYAPIRAGNGSVYQIIKIATDINDQKELEQDILRKNKYLEHAAKILRHDMHSGINTYIPRGLRSLKRRLSEDQIKELKIEAPIKLITDGLAHTQKVYEGVKEFTNLVKDNIELEKTEQNLAEILNNYLTNTAYADQVVIDRLPTILVNEPLFCTAIDNMIRNGLKYNDSSSKMVAITMVDDYHLAIIDNGRGMSQEDFDTLSQPYVRKDGQAESGSGLGLNITVAILKEHNFSVSVEKQEQGTMIKVKIR